MGDTLVLCRGTTVVVHKFYMLVAGLEHVYWVVIFILHVCVSCGFLRGSLQLSLLCFCIIMLCVQTVTYSARIGVCSSRKEYCVELGICSASTHNLTKMDKVAMAIVVLCNHALS